MSKEKTKHANKVTMVTRPAKPHHQRKIHLALAFCACLREVTRSYEDLSKKCLSILFSMFYKTSYLVTLF